MTLKTVTHCRDWVRVGKRRERVCSQLKQNVLLPSYSYNLPQPFLSVFIPPLTPLGDQARELSCSSPLEFFPFLLPWQIFFCFVHPGQNAVVSQVKIRNLISFARGEPGTEIERRETKPSEGSLTSDLKKICFFSASNSPIRFRGILGYSFLDPSLSTDLSAFSTGRSQLVSVPILWY